VHRGCPRRPPAKRTAPARVSVHAWAVPTSATLSTEWHYSTA
jgi:hypothetical protein